MNCPKCGHARESGEAAPRTHCPACGVFYAKVEPAPDPAIPPRIVLQSDPPRGSWGIGKTFALLVFFAGVYAFTPLSGMLGASSGNAGRGKFRDADFSRARIVMYSHTTCRDCTELRRKFEAGGVPFEEHFIDKDAARMQEMFAKLKDAGHAGGVSTPTLEVNHRMMINNPSFDRIIKAALH